MQNKLFAILITALLVLCMAGSAMCATYDFSVTLENKVDGVWQPILGDGISAVVEYNSVGEEFAWHAYGTAQLADTPYSLIYYADPWPGNNPGALIGTMTTDGDGDFDENGSTELDNLPHPDDANIDCVPDFCDYNNTFDDYENCHGAKLWMIPSNNYDEPALIAWNPDNYLFETDLIWYDDTDYNIPPEIKDAVADPSCVAAGDTVMVSAEVKDRDGQYDLENMIVTANMSEYGADNNIVLNYTGMKNHIKAYYSANVTVTVSTIDECNGEYRSFDIYAEDPSGANDTREAYLDVEPGQCSYMKFHNGCDYDGDEELNTVALTQLTHCDTKDYTRWWSHSDKFGIYMIRYTIHLYDEYDNHISCINRAECCDGFDATTSGVDASLKYDEGERSRIIMINENNPGETTVTVNCLYGDVPSISQTVEFLNPIASIDVTSDVDTVCSMEEGNLNISAQILDVLGDPILMPGVLVKLYIDNELEDDSETDENGTATFESDYESPEDGSVTFRCWSECKNGSITLDVVEPVITTVEIDDVPYMSAGEYELMSYTCYNQNGNEMDCPDSDEIWSCNKFGEINETTGNFTAIDCGLCVVAVDVSGIIDTEEFGIICNWNCTSAVANESFVLTSGSVSLTGNFTYDCELVCIQVSWFPVFGFDNITRIVSVDTCESATLNLSGEGDIWSYNGILTEETAATDGNWSFYTAGDTADVGYGLYALVYDEPVPDPDPEPTPTATTRSSRGGGGGGIYPPDPAPTPDADNETDNETEQDDPKPATAKTADAKPTVNLPGGDATLDTTPDDEDEAPGAADPTNMILVVLALLAVIVIGYIVYQKSQD